VMNAGRIVELAESEELYRNPLHPYTKSLLSAVPTPVPEIESKKLMKEMPKTPKSYYNGNILNEVSKGHWVLQ